MTWVKLDDCANEHQKQVDAGAEACWLWACGLMYCNRQKNRTGFIPSEQVRGLYVRFSVRVAGNLAADLVRVGLWEKAEGGFLVHDYHVYQPGQELSAIRSEAGKKGGVRSGETRRNKHGPPEANGFKATAKHLLLSDEATASARARRTGSGSGSGSDLGGVQGGATESGYDLARKVWQELWQARYREGYSFSVDTGVRGEDRVLQRLGAMALEHGTRAETELRRRIAAYLANNADWLTRNRHPLKTFEQDWNQYGAAMTAEEATPVVDYELEAKRLAKAPVRASTPEGRAKALAIMNRGAGT